MSEGSEMKTSVAGHQKNILRAARALESHCARKESEYVNQKFQHLRLLATMRSQNIPRDAVTHPLGSPGKGGSLQIRGIPRGKFPTQPGYVKHTLPYPLQRLVTLHLKIRRRRCGGVKTTKKVVFNSNSNEGHVCCVSDVCGAHGMERNIGDQLNKAFEAYRQVSIEKDNAKRELQQMTEYYERYTQKLQKQIEDQQQLISKLEAKLATRQPSGEMKCEPCNHLLDEAAYRKTQYTEKMGTVAVSPNIPINSSIDYQDMLGAFEAIQGKFRQIQSLTRKQKDHLKRFHGGNDASNDQRFSMPIQCTDHTAEAERPFSTALRSAVDVPLPPTSLASRGASPEDRDLVDSLTKLSVKFPPSADSEYDFLNSTPERHMGLTVPVKRPLINPPSTLTEEEPIELPMPFVYPPSPSHSTSSSLSQEGVWGPQQPLWSPKLSDAVDVWTELATPQSSSPDKCAFCHAVVPQDRMNSHLYSHFSHKNEAED
ncbi:TRAF family member-associated NF-kappa-B activator isoform X1 [Xyrichtys novacula]|uniref:TRAF family member-associated NF-kappa-B activator isoform X1 n=1 Tax=Xyrichtys novacula TaxID=13765 RepID=A0AAV1H1G8_XYRNO|nr:TRAF family member-associated NF-kappa-B activator isoform X1 [Xyrichtys novacula]